MKKLLVVIGLALALSGCKYLEPITGVDNPVTAKDLYAVEQVMVATVAGLNTYRNACVRKQIDQRCRDVIVQVQSFTKPAAAILPRLRTYVKTNDKINAVNAYNLIVGLLADARAVAKTNGVVVP